MSAEEEQYQDEYEGDDFFEDDFIPDVDPEEADDLDLDEFNDDLDHDARDDMVAQTEKVEATLHNPSDRKAFRTRSYLSKYEKAAMIAIRAEQLARGAAPLVSIEMVDPVNKTTELITNYVEIAQKELAEGVMPLTIDRPTPSRVANCPIYETRPASTLIHSTNPGF